MLGFWPGPLDWMMLPALAALLALLYALGLAIDADAASRWQRAFHTVGGFGLLATIFYGSFAESWKRLDVPALPTTPGTWALAVVAALLILSTLALIVRGILTRKAAHSLALGALPLVFIGADLLARRTEPDVSAIALNGVGALIGGLAIWSGLRHASLFRTNAGLALIGSLIAARFFDSEWSFAWRGSAFIALGLLTLALNLWIVRSSRASIQGKEAS
jgi:hypothetical protein